MSQFKVGDICILQNVIGDYAYLNGSEVTITSPLLPRKTSQHPDKEILCYGIDLKVDTNQNRVVWPHQLRRKPDPKTDQWADNKVKELMSLKQRSVSTAVA